MTSDEFRTGRLIPVATSLAHQATELLSTDPLTHCPLTYCSLNTDCHDPLRRLRRPRPRAPLLPSQRLHPALLPALFGSAGRSLSRHRRAPPAVVVPVARRVARARPGD